MLDDLLAAEVEDLKRLYGGVARATGSGGKTLVRLTAAKLPPGCQPEATPALLAWQPGQTRPEMYVAPGVRRPNGASPRSTSTVFIEGEAWLQFSYTFPWEPARHSLVQFVAGGLRRFAKHE